MPKYTFICDKCGNTQQKFVPAKRLGMACDKCDGQMIREMPKLSGPAEVRETIDQHTGVTWKKDQQEMIKERQEDYFWTVEVPRLVQTYSLETCLEQGWCYVDDDGKVQLHTKPPHKR